MKRLTMGSYLGSERVFVAELADEETGELVPALEICSRCQEAPPADVDGLCPSCISDVQTYLGVA